LCSFKNRKVNKNQCNTLFTQYISLIVRLTLSFPIGRFVPIVCHGKEKREREKGKGSVKGEGEGKGKEEGEGKWKGK